MSGKIEGNKISEGNKMYRFASYLMDVQRAKTYGVQLELGH